MWRGIAALWLLVAANLGAAAQADEIVRLRMAGTVPDVMNRLIVAVERSGALVFARVDHAGGAQIAGAGLAPMEVLIFGDPRLVTPALQAAPMAGLALPMRMLAYQDAEGQVWLAWRDPAEILETLGGDPAAAAPIAEALRRLAEQVAG